MKYYVVAVWSSRWRGEKFRYWPIYGPYATLHEARRKKEETARKILLEGEDIVDVEIKSRTFLAQHGFPRSRLGEFLLDASLRAGLGHPDVQLAEDLPASSED
jgi:hypothetical protein